MHMIGEVLEGEGTYEQMFYFIFIVLDFFLLFESFRKLKNWGKHFRIVTYYVMACMIIHLISLWLVLHNETGFEDNNFYFLLVFTVALVYAALLEFRFFEDVEILKEVRNKHDFVLVKGLKIFGELIHDEFTRSEKTQGTIGVMVICLALSCMCLTYSTMKYSQNSGWF